MSVRRARLAADSPDRLPARSVMMLLMHDSPSEKPLRREVQPPQRQPTGLGVMLIASAAMFFAVAGSAFVVRARMAGHCCDRAHPPAHVQARTAPPRATKAEAPCGEAAFRHRPDGTVAVDFRLCPPDDR
jgi:hypothetical protein